jgi:SAM-dependent methyltransferase
MIESDAEPADPMATPRASELLRCPRCGNALGLAARACACGLSAQLRGSVLDFLAGAARSREAADVQAFYDRNPFPGYAAGDDAATLIDRSLRSPFLAALDAATAPDARVLDCGSGTAQLAAFLALTGPRREVIALDGCPASLDAADRFRAREHIDNLTLVRGDLFDLPVAERAFDVVVCRGVIHHTPRPWAALEGVARCVAPGGHLLVGIYERVARLPHRWRCGVARLTGRPVAWLDPVLRRRDLDPAKRAAWIADQYEHPLEHLLSFPKLARELERLGFAWVRSVPPAPDGAPLFDPTARPARLGLELRRLGWAWRCCFDEDAGLVALVARRVRDEI